MIGSNETFFQVVQPAPSAAQPVAEDERRTAQADKR
jgi:hypothetical protein